MTARDDRGRFAADDPMDVKIRRAAGFLPPAADESEALEAPAPGFDGGTTFAEEAAAQERRAPRERTMDEQLRDAFAASRAEK